jgi:hypothetical protein
MRREQQMGKPEPVKSEEEVILKVTKEIAIKYIEIGRLALGNFDEAFKGIYKTVRETVQKDT